MIGTVPVPRRIFISRHRGAIDWAQRRGLEIDHWWHHLDIDDVRPGDVVIGSLPVNLAAAVCERRAEYWHLTLILPEEARGRELTAAELEALSAHLDRYHIERRSSP